MNASETGGSATPDHAVDPGTLTWAVRLLFAEAVALALVTAFLVYENLTATATSPQVGIALTVFAGLAAAGLAVVARALARRSPAARGPAVVVQLMLVVVSGYLVRGGLLEVGIPLGLVGVGVGVLLLAPPTTRALELS